MNSQKKQQKQTNNKFNILFILFIFSLYFASIYAEKTATTNGEGQIKNNSKQQKIQHHHHIHQIHNNKEPKLMTVIECKTICTIDWQDCVTDCGNDGQPSCYQSCQKTVQQCLDSCPSIICHHDCQLQLDQCNKENNNNNKCESNFIDCQQDCENAYIGRVDL